MKVPSGLPRDSIESLKSLLADADCPGPASVELIEAVEAHFGVKFPAQYRAFMGHCGAALCGGFEVYGLVDGARSSEGPVWTDLRGALSKRLKRSLEENLLPISDDGADHKFYLRTGLDSQAVVVYGPGSDGVQVAEDFFSFLVCAAESGVQSLVPGGPHGHSQGGLVSKS